MSEGTQGSGDDRRIPPTGDDRATAEMTAVGRQAAEGPPRPAPPNGQRPATPQPSASGWTPPPLPGRQTPPPAAPRPATPEQPPAARQVPAVANGRPGGLPLPTPAPDRSSPATPPAPTPGDTAPTAADTAAAPRQQSFWQRVTEGLGFERKPVSPAAPEAADESAAPVEAPGAQPTRTEAPVAVLATDPSSVAPTPGQQYRVDNRTGGAEHPTASPDEARATAPVPATAPSPGRPGTGTRPGAVVAPRAAATAIVAGAAGATGAGAGTASSTEVLANGPKPGATPTRRTRKARLRLSRLDPWSVMKTSFLFSIAAGIMLVVAVYAVWAVLSTSGLFSSINDIISIVVSTPGDTTPFEVQDYVSSQRVMGVAALIACVDVLIFTALATLASFLYNLAATMLGGLEITLAED